MNKNLKEEEDDDEQEEEQVKVVLIGESGVGKTSIISQFISGKFKPGALCTHGATFSNKTKKFKEFQRTISFEIWDTAGQEKYRSLNSMFFKDASVALIVYDITSQKTFEEVENYWANAIKENGPKNIIIYLVGNKSDLFTHEEVKEQVARQYAKDQNILFWLTSAKDGPCIEKLFDDIGKRYLSPEFNQSEENKERKKRKSKSHTIKINSLQIKKNKNGNKNCCG